MTHKGCLAVKSINQSTNAATTVFSFSYLKVPPEVVDGDVAFVVGVQAAESLDVQVDLVLGEVDGHILGGGLEILTHLRLQEAHRILILFLSSRKR